MSVEEIDNEQGVENIQSALRRPLQTRAVYLKRRYLHEYEYIGRHGSESIRAFCNRYQRAEKSLLATGINVTAMYDGESRGSRLLDRMRLTPEQQRLVLVSTGQSLQFDAIRDAAQLQYPEHRPVPAVAYSREFDNGNRGNEPPRHPAPKGGKADRDSSKGGKPKGKGGRQPYRAYVAEEAQQPDEKDPPDLPDIPEDNEEQDDSEEDDELIPDGDDQQDDGTDLEAVMQEVAECLTVTARRLQGVTLGRKFTNNPKDKGIEQRKRNSHCAACGQKGHWQGDDVCPVSAKGAKGAGKGGGKTDTTKKGSGPKKVMTVIHHNASEPTASQEPGTPSADDLQEFGSYFTTFMTNFAGPIQDVFLSQPGDFAGYAVLDTACQRNLCSERWLTKHRTLLKTYKLDVKATSESEGFQFGTGPVQVSKKHIFFPVCLDGTAGTCALFGASVMPSPSELPLLLSLDMLSKKLKTVLDLPRNIAYVGAFNIEIPIVKINGHICIALNQFPRSHFAHWQALSSILDQGTQDAEFIEPSPPPATSAAHVCAAASTTMASGLEESGEIHPPSRASPTSVSDPDRAAGIENEGMAVASRSAAPEVDRQHDSSHEGSLRPSSEHAGKERKPPREFPKVLPVQHPLEVGGGRVGRAAIFTIAAAVATLGQLWGPNPMGRQAAPGTGCRGGHDNLLGPTIGEWFEAQAEAFSETARGTGFHRVGAEIHAPRGRSRSHQPANGPAERRPGVSRGALPGEPSNTRAASVGTGERLSGATGMGGPRGGGRNSGGARRGVCMGSGPGSLRLKPGHQTWLVSELRKTRSNYDREIAIHRDMPTYKDVYDLPKIDILEVYAGRATITDQAVNYGLTALQPYGFKYGVDLTIKQQARAFQDTVRRFRPLFVICRWPRQSTDKRPTKDLEDLYDLGAWACAEQDREGRFFVGEYETTGPLWSRPSILDLVRRKNVTDFTCTSGSYGAEDADGYPDIRRHRWLSNHPGMHRKLSNELTEEQQAYCSPTPGDSSNGREPEDLCHGIVHSILETIQTEARLQYPARFQLKPHDVLYARPLNDAESWKQVLDEIENRFANTHKKPFVLTGTDPLRELIDNLVPWRIEKLQAAWTPQSRRFPQDIAFTHRGAALRLTTGEFALESEDMGQITYPKQRYARPVRVGLFFFGFPKETREPEEAPADNRRPLPARDPLARSTRKCSTAWHGST